MEIEEEAVEEKKTRQWQSVPSIPHLCTHTHLFLISHLICLPISSPFWTLFTSIHSDIRSPSLPLPCGDFTFLGGPFPLPFPICCPVSLLPYRSRTRHRKQQRQPSKQENYVFPAAIVCIACGLKHGMTMCGISDSVLLVVMGSGWITPAHLPHCTTFPLLPAHTTTLTHSHHSPYMHTYIHMHIFTSQKIEMRQDKDDMIFFSPFICLTTTFLIPFHLHSLLLSHSLHQLTEVEWRSGESLPHYSLPRWIGLHAVPSCMPVLLYLLPYVSLPCLLMILLYHICLCV